jgi:hypothetical protein
VANLPLRLAVRVRCAQFDGVHARVPTRRFMGTSRVHTPYSRGVPPPGYRTQRGMLCRRQSAPSPRAPAHARLLTLCANVRLQGMELLVTVLLARNRPPLPTAAAGGPHAELAAELITLPSGLLAMVCEAIVKLKVRRGGAACACVGVCSGADEVRAQAKRMAEYCAQCSPLGLVRADGVRSAGGTTCSTGLVLLRFPMWSEPSPLPSVRALCAVVRD